MIIGQILAMLLTGMVALGGVAAWRLQAGPVELEFLTPYLEEALSAEDGRFTVDIGQTVAVWAGWRNAIDIRATHLSVSDAEGTNLAQIPELSLGLSVRALAQGRLEPTSLDAIGPSIRVIRRETGEFSLGFFEAESGAAAAAEDPTTQNSREVAAFLLEELLAEPDPEREFGYLRKISLIDARLVFEDRVADGYYRASKADLVLLRGGGGITGGAGMALDYAGRAAVLTVDVAISSIDKSYNIDFSFNQIEPAAFAASIPQLSQLAVVKTPLNGEVSVRGHLGGKVDEIGFDFIAGNGLLDLNEFYREPLEVNSLRLTGAVTDDLRALRIEQAVIGLGDASVSAQATIVPDGAGREIALQARVENMAMSELHRYWPAWTHPTAHDWVATNIVRGVVDEGTVALRLRVGGEGEPAAALGQLEGTLAFTGLDVHYKRPMTPIVGGSGTATFDRHGFVFSIGGATLAQQIRLEEGTVRIANIDKKGEARLIVDAKANGPLPVALRVLDEEPLHYGSKMGFDPDKMSGEGTSALHFELPLIRNIKGDMLEVDVTSQLEGVAAPGPLDLAVTEGSLDLAVNRKAMRVAGDVRLNGVPTGLVWDENFQNVKKFRRRFTVKGTVGDADRRALGLPDLSYWLQGPVDAQLVYTIRDGKNDRLSVRGDAARALIKVEEADWRKEPGAPGTGAITGYVTRKGGLVLDSFNVQTGNMDAELAMEFPPSLENIAKVTIKKALYRGNDVAGTITPRKEGGYNFSMDLGRFDARHLLTFENGAGGKDGGDEEDSPFFIKSGFTEVITAEGRAMHQGIFFSEWDGKHWTLVDLEGKLDTGAELKVKFSPDEKRDFDLSIASHDAGQALRTLDWWGEIEGGALEVRGKRKGLDGPISGSFKVLDFRYTEAPAGLRLLQVITIIGLPSAAAEGVPFQGLEGTYTYEKGVLTFGEIEGWGTVGVKLDKGGWIDFNERRLGFAGVVIPANTVQGLLGKIPILNLIFQDGLIASNFTVSGSFDDPKVNASAMSVGLPFLRRLFRITPRKDGVEDNPDGLPGASPPPRDD